VLLVVAPIGEEMLFRGFLFRGWHRSLRDAWPAIIVTAALWALIRGQYDLYGIAQIFAYGRVLLHGLINFAGMLETFMAFHA
jgi:CAAX protease family protein